MDNKEIEKTETEDQDAKKEEKKERKTNIFLKAVTSSFVLGQPVLLPLFLAAVPGADRFFHDNTSVFACVLFIIYDIFLTNFVKNEVSFAFGEKTSEKRDHASEIGATAAIILSALMMVSTIYLCFVLR